jgi:predicted nucleic acid-binding protein
MFVSTPKMPEIIFDTCVLSNFAMADALSILKHLYQGSAHLTAFAGAEILRGIQGGHLEMGRIMGSVRDGWLEEVNLSLGAEKDLFEELSLSLGLGEASSLAVAKARKWVLASDDRAARYAAQARAIKLTGTVGILITAARKGLISEKRAEDLLSTMIKRGFYAPVHSLRGIKNAFR